MTQTDLSKSHGFSGFAVTSWSLFPRNRQSESHPLRHPMRMPMSRMANDTYRPRLHPLPIPSDTLTIAGNDERAADVRSDR